METLDTLSENNSRSQKTCLGYSIPNKPINNTSNRKVKVLGIGAGISGIMMAYKIQKFCQNVDLKIIEKNKDIGGTWFENRYPNCACDIPSHAYSFKWAPNPDWPRFFSQSADIWQYLDEICKVFRLRRYMTFNTCVVECRWIPELGQWRVKYEENVDGKSQVFEETCDVLLHSTGVLNKLKWPSVEGLDVFKGKVVHTAAWPEDYGNERWQNEKVAVIGSGASSIQTVPGMQPFVEHLDIFIRTAVWFVQIASNYGQNYEYSCQEKSAFRRNKKRIVEHAKDLEDQVNGIFDGFFRDSDSQKELRDTYTERMASMITNENLRKGFTPSFAVGCRRVTPGDPYIEAIQQPNVSVHFTGVHRLTESGVIGMDGVERKVDTVVCATGLSFSSDGVGTMLNHFRIRCLIQTNFPANWRTWCQPRHQMEVPECYMGVTIPGFPNILTFIGPTWPISNGSCLGPLDAVGDYAIQMIQKLQMVPSMQSFSPRQDLTDAFNDHVQEWIKHTVWADDCRSWYRNNETGRVNAVWPGSSLHFIEAIKDVRWEDYEIKYKPSREGKPENPFSWLGMGFAKANRSVGADKSPYFNEAAIDEQWWKAVTVS